MTGPKAAAGAALAAVVLAVAALATTSAWAGESGLVVDAPTAATAGEIVEVHVTASNSTAEPAGGVTITVAYWTEFGGVGDWLELARATTDEDGVATLSFQQRSFGTSDLRVEQLGIDGVPTDSSGFSISETPGGPQLYTSTAGVSIPWLNATAVLALVAAVWSFIVYAAIQLYQIRRPEKPMLADPLTPASASASHGERGAASFGVVVAIIAATAAITILIVVARNPLTHANLSGPENYERTEIAHLGHDEPYLGLGDGTDPDATGETLYFTTGCAGCHGLDGQGGIGPDLIDELGSVRRFTNELRDAPEGMPAFSPDVLTDDQIQAIHDYLTDTDTDTGAPPP